MKKFIFTLFLTFLVCFGALAKTLEQKKTALKKIYESGGISKIEYNKAQESLKNSEEKIKEKKSKTFILGKKEKNKTKSIFKGNKKKSQKILNKGKDKEKITLEKIEELGPLIKFDITYYPAGMSKELIKGCVKSFKCQAQRAGTYMSKVFNKDKSYGQKNPGKMIKAMAMFEVMYAQKLWAYRKPIERFKENNYKKGLLSMKRKDDKQIRTLLGMNKGRKGMRTALGMTLETPAKDAMKSFWSLGAFLDLGTGVNNKKLAKDLKEREKLLEAYKAEISKLRKKLQSDLDDEGENEKSVQ